MSTVAPSISSIDPLSPEFLIDPQAAFQDLLRETPVFFYEPLNAYFVLSYDDVRRVLGEDQTYSSHAYRAMPVPARLRDRVPEEWERVGQVIQGGQTINLDAPDHTWQRRAVQQAFTRKRVQDAKPGIAAIANELLDGIVEQGSCDLMRDFGIKLTLSVVGRMLDLPPDMLTGFQAWIIDMFGLLSPIDVRPEDVTMPDEQIAGIYERVHSAYLVYAELLEQRRANPGEDLCSAMLTLTNDDSQPTFSNDQVLTHMVGITTAGGDTSANLIVNMVRYFTESPDQLQLVLDDPRLWDNAVLEGIRRAGISASLFRISRCESELSGVTIPAGSNVCVSVAAANADPRKFPDPLRFDVRRDNVADHLGLGRGRHFCLGAPLVPPESRIALELLYERLPGLKADLDQELEFVKSISIRGIISQRVTWSVS